MTIADEGTGWLVVGLGNPGPEYQGNRHNIGFMVLDVLAARTGVKLGRHRRAGALVGEGRLGIGGPRVVVAKPMTYMNLSGGPVAGLSGFYRVPVEQVIAIHDDLDLLFAQLRIKRGGGEGGHNGLRSLTRSLGSKEYVRVRLGIGRPPGRQDPADYVLTNFSAAQRKELEPLLDVAADAVESVITRGVEATQNAYNGL